MILLIRLTKSRIRGVLSVFEVVHVFYIFIIFEAIRSSRMNDETLEVLIISRHNGA